MRLYNVLKFKSTEVPPVWFLLSRTVIITK